MKKIISGMLSVIMAWNMLGLAPAFEQKAYAATEGIYTYTVSNGEATITNCDTSARGAITIPSILGGYPVTSIGDGAFGECNYLTLVTIPGSITSIGYCAFSSCDSLSLVNIRNGVKRIGNFAFDNCTRLTSITIPNSVTLIGESAFGYCISLTSITIPDSVTSIIRYAFYQCTSLTSVTIPNSISSIGERSFSGCERLTTVNIPNSVISIGEEAFSGCISLTSVTIPNSVTSINYQAFSGCYKLTSITIPNSVTSISAGTFFACNSLTSITIPNSVTSIGESAFSNCNSLTSITIPNSITSIDDDVFFNCTSLTSVTIPNSVTSIGDSAFSHCTSLASVAIPDSVTSIGNYAFGYCELLTSITIPNSVTYIGGGAFCACSLASVNIPNSVTSILERTFSDCYKLTSITIPNSVTYIGDWTFCNCNSLTSVTIPNSVTYISTFAFSSCTSLTAIHVDTGNLNYASQIGILFNKTKTQLVAYPNGKSGAYTIPSSVTSITNYAFYYCTSLTSVTIPISVTSIGKSAFYSCTSLTSVTIPNSVTSIGESAFYSCTSLTSVTIPNSVTYINYQAFSGCYGFTICGYNGSYAQTYAQNNSFPFKSIGGAQYSISIAQMQGGSVTANYNSAGAGTTVSLTVSPSKGNILKRGTLQYNGNPVSGTAFIMPADNVTITAEFEPVSEASLDNIVFGGKVNLTYPKNLGVSDDTAVPPIPSGSDSQYAEELKYWADAYGHELNGLDYTKAVKTPFKMPYMTTTNQVVFEKESSVTVKDVMADIIMLGKMQEYVIKEENSLKKNVTVDKLNSSTKTMLKYLGRYNEYIGSQSGQRYDPRTTTKTLAAIEAIINNVWGKNYSSAKLLDMFKSSAIELNPALDDIMFELKNAQTSNSLYKAQNDMLAAVSIGTNVYKVAKGEQSYIYDIAGAAVDASGNSNLKKAKSYSDTIKGIYDFLKLCEGDFGPAMASLKITSKYLEFCVDMYNWVTDQYPSWLFYSNYYLPASQPGYFTQIGFDKDGNIPFGSWGVPQLENCDDLSLKLLSALNNTDTDSIYIQQFNTSNDNKRSLISAAATLADIRLTDYKALQKYLLDYISAQCLPIGKAKTIKVSCPVLVTILNSQGEELFTLNTDESYSQNYNQYCTFYLSGENRDEKTFIVNENYNFKITPYANGEMDCAVNTVDEDGEIKEYSYKNVPIDISSNYKLSTVDVTAPTLEKISTEGTEQIPATEESILVDQIIINENYLELHRGETKQLYVEILPPNANDQTVLWISSNSDVVNIDNNGLITAISAGTATITAYSGKTNVYTTCEVTVVPLLSDQTTINFQTTTGGTISTTISETYLIGSELTVYAIANAGYVFSGWESSDGGEIKNILSEYTVYTVPNTSSTLIARFLPTGLMFTEKKISQNNIEVQYFTMGDLLASAKAYNGTQDNKDVTIILALYDGNNQLLRMNSQKYTVKPSEDLPISVSINISKAYECKLRLLFWDDLDSLVPSEQFSEFFPYTSE